MLAHLRATIPSASPPCQRRRSGPASRRLAQNVQGWRIDEGESGGLAFVHQDRLHAAFGSCTSRPLRGRHLALDYKFRFRDSNVFVLGHSRQCSALVPGSEKCVLPRWPSQVRFLCQAQAHSDTARRTHHFNLLCARCCLAARCRP